MAIASPPPVVFTPPAINPISTSNGAKPAQANVGSVVLMLTAGVPLTFDLGVFLSQRQIGQLQGMFADCSQATGFTQVVASATGHDPIVPPGWQMSTPLFVSPPGRMIVTGEGPVTLVFTNFETPLAIWPASPIGLGSWLFGLDGTLKKNHSGTANAGTYLPADFGTDLSLVVPADSNHYPFINALYVDTGDLKASTPGLIDVSLNYQGVFPIYKKSLYVETVPSPGNCRASLSLDNLQIEGNLGFTLNLNITANGAAGFTGHVNFTAICDEDTLPL